MRQNMNSDSWKRGLRRDKRGVSPVIAVILMVAITVVLAAVLYVMVGSLVPDGTNMPTTVSLDVEREDMDTLRMEFISTSSPVKWSGIRIIVEGDGPVQSYVLNSDCNGYEGDGSLELNLTDYSGSGCNQRINQGDYISVEGFDQGIQYIFIIFDTENEGKVGESIYNT